MTHNAYTTKGYMTYREITEVLGVSAGVDDDEEIPF